MKRWLLLIISLAMILSLACSFLQPNNPPVTDEPGALNDGELDDNGDGDSGDSGNGDGTTDDDEQFSLDTDAFSQLDYYRSTIVMRYEKGDGSVEETTIETAFIREPSAQAIVMEVATGSTEMIQIGDQMWINFGGEWMQTSADEGSDITDGFGSFMGISDDLEQIEQGDYEYKGTETIDGIKTRHYQGESLAPWMMALSNTADDVQLESGVLDVWVADESDLPKFTVKTVLVMEGTVGDAEAKYTMTQTVTDINQPFTIEPPPMDEIGGLPEGVPMYPDATEVTTFGGMTVFSSGDSVEDVAAFYNNALESGGWERTQNTEIESMVSSEWLKDGVTLALNISLGDEDTGSSVMIITGEE